MAVAAGAAAVSGLATLHSLFKGAKFVAHAMRKGGQVLHNVGKVAAATTQTARLLQALTTLVPGVGRIASAIWKRIPLSKFLERGFDLAEELGESWVIYRVALLAVNRLFLGLREDTLSEAQASALFDQANDSLAQLDSAEGRGVERGGRRPVDTAFKRSQSVLMGDVERLGRRARGRFPGFGSEASGRGAKAARTSL